MIDPVTMYQLLGVAGMGAASIGGSALTARTSYKYTRRLQEQQQAWAEKMANTAHQREVKDLRAAGLNPILSANGGSGAASPAVSTPQFQVPNPIDSVIDSASALANLQNVSAQSKLASANAELATQKAKAVEQENRIRGKTTKAGSNILDVLSDAGSRLVNYLSAPSGAKLGPNGQRLAVPTKKLVKTLVNNPDVITYSSAKEREEHYKMIRDALDTARKAGFTEEELKDITPHWYDPKVISDREPVWHRGKSSDGKRVDVLYYRKKKKGNKK